MTMKVTMSIKGDAMIYERNDVWNVAFITDDCHKLNFSADGAAPSSLRVAGVTRYLTVKPENPTSDIREPGTNFDKILNMNSDKLHGLTDGKSNLVTEQNSPPGRELVHMTVPVGVVSSENFVDYWYAEYPGGQQHDFDHKVARIIKIDFELAENSGLSIELKDEHGSQTFNYAPKENLDLEFDNDCQAVSTEDDFLHYYDWVYDKRDTPAKKIRFIAGKKSTSSAPESVTGNCDPVSGWPDLGGS